MSTRLTRLERAPPSHMAGLTSMFHVKTSSIHVLNMFYRYGPARAILIIITYMQRQPINVRAKAQSGANDWDCIHLCFHT